MCWNLKQVWVMHVTHQSQFLLKRIWYYFHFFLDLQWFIVMIYSVFLMCFIVLFVLSILQFILNYVILNLLNINVLSCNIFVRMLLWFGFLYYWKKLFKTKHIHTQGQYNMWSKVIGIYFKEKQLQYLKPCKWIPDI